LKGIEKFRGSGDPESGFKLFVCEGCQHVQKVPYRCKERFYHFSQEDSFLKEHEGHSRVSRWKMNWLK